MTGYEKSPDYGGPPVTKWTYVKMVLFFAAWAGVGWWMLS